jgi:hypothetical protein
MAALDGLRSRTNIGRTVRTKNPRRTAPVDLAAATPSGKRLPPLPSPLGSRAQGGCDARLIPEIRSLFPLLDAPEVKATVERLGLPFAPVCTPIELLDDPHLNSNDGMIDVVLSNGMASKLPALPLTLGGKRLGGKRPRAPYVGEHTSEAARSTIFGAPVTQGE